MKNFTYLVAFVFFIGVSNTTSAQEIVSTPDFDHKVEISALVGYQLNGSLNFVQGDMKFDDAINYSFALSVNAGYGTYIETIYSYCATNVRLRTWYPGYEPNQPNFNVDIHYIQLGGVKEFMDGRVRPFGSLTLGASGFVPVDVSYESWWQFAINLGLGVKINITENIGIRAQARLLMPMYLSGLGIFCGGGGCSSGFTTTSNILQGDFSGGLVIGF